LQFALRFRLSVSVGGPITGRGADIIILDELKRNGMCGVKPYQPEPGSDKLMRFAAQTIKFEQGQVMLPSAAPWLGDYLAELTGFPGTKFDDQVDSTSQALDFMNDYCKLTIYDVL
jgi:predicted phage terminase large subunit-like protein